MHFLSRRRFLAGASLSLGGVALAGCATTQPVIGLGDAEPFAKPGPAADYAVMYGPVTDEPFPIPAVDLKLLDPVYYRQEVDDPTGEAPGTIVVNTGERFLYHVGDGGRATRYGVGIGRAGFAWSGRAHIAYKRRWPTWTP
ncbi:MAG: L,D-transpeptidase, partial [Rhodobiaceae bacterium]|nr:L,D-transpeptidase [Rhodobiaceae bacterium]